MTFGKVVVGPKIGCMDWVLKTGKNLVYEAGNVTALINAMNAASSVDLQDCARVNKLAAEDWNWRDFSEAVLSALCMNLRVPAGTHHMMLVD